jgi:hypothetical protein
MRRTLVLSLWVLLVPPIALGQSVRVTNADENFRAEPGGVILGTLVIDTELQSGAHRDSWRETTLEGWIWAPSVRADSRPGFDLVVSARNGENLRAEPNGARIARLQSGALLVRVEQQGQWYRVRRTGWVRATALSGPAPSAEPSPGEAEESAAAKAATATMSATPPASGPQPRPGGADELAWTGQGGAKLLNAPAGDTLADIRPLSALAILERQGDWARIRAEGWVWAPSLGTPADSGMVLSGVAPEVLRSNPEGFRGRVLEWQVQFIAFDRAEKIRTDFTEGELFILARPPGDQPGFVYLAVPEGQAARVKALTALQRITVLARVRTGRSAQMGAPILDLIEIR